MPKSKSSKSGGSKKNKNESKNADGLKPKDYLTKEVQSSITLIETPEQVIALDALLILSKYADFNVNNIVSLQSLGLLPKLLKQFDRNICMLRLSLRLVSQLLTIDEGLYEMDDDIQNEKILEITEMFVSHKDQFVRDFCLAITERLSTTRRLDIIATQIKLLKAIFTTLKTQKKELVLPCTILFCRLIDITSIITELSSGEFDLGIFLMQMNNFDTVNLTLEIYRKLASFGLLTKLLPNFFTFAIESTILEDQLKALAIITVVLDNDNALSLVETLQFLQFCEWVKDCPDEALPLSSDILQRISRISSIKQLLFDLSVEDAFLSYFRTDSMEILNKACEMISNMTSHKYCCEKMLTPIVIKKLLDMLPRADPNSALKTLYDFTKRHTKTIHMLFQYSAYEILFKLLTDTERTVSDENYVRILEIFNMFLFHPRYKTVILTQEFYSLLLEQIQLLICLEMLINSINHESFQKNFMELNGPQIIINNFYSARGNDLITNLLLFLHNCLMYKCIATKFLHLRIINLLKMYFIQMPLAGKILNIFYNLFLPIKFFETNRLELTDKLEDCFYIINGPWEDPFPFLEILELRQISTLYSIYVVDCCEKTRTSVCNINYGKLSHDPYLLDYVIKLQNIMATENCICIENKIKIIADFINIRMCGPKEEDIHDKLHSFKFHIQCIKNKLGTNMIPIGYLRLGFQCERALLFKALADQLQIPATLVKGKKHFYWNEVALVKMDYKKGHLEMFVVDLMDNIGELYPLGSRECNIYCNIKDY